MHLLILAILVLLTATDLEQRRLPHLLLDPLLLVAALFVPFNPSVSRPARSWGPARESPSWGPWDC